jgi:hypothetical protein
MNQVKETTQTNARILMKIRFKMQIKITKKTGNSLKLPFQGKLIYPEKLYVARFREKTLAVAYA